MLFVAWLPRTTLAQFDFEKEPIHYSQTQAHDAIAELISKLESGESVLKWDEQRGWLPSLLEHLEVSSKSQVLTFSKTSLQIRHIDPSTPRAIYFSDDVYLGWIPTGELIEMSAVDDQLGAVFYTIRQTNAQPRNRARSYQLHDLSWHFENEKRPGIPCSIGVSFPQRSASLLNGLNHDRS